MRKGFLYGAVLLLTASGCAEDKNKSAFTDLLNREPYKLVTDSIKEMPDNDQLYFRRAVMLNRDQHTQPALADFKKAWSISPQEQYAVGVGNLLNESMPDSAITFLKEARKQLPGSMYLSLLLAKMLDSRQRYDEAIILCDTILAQEPLQVNTLVLKADMLEKKRDYPGMIQALEKAYTVLPGNIELVDRLMLQYAETNNAKVIPLADSLIAVDKQRMYTSPYYVKGVYYVNIKDQEKALAQFDLALKHDHRYLNAYIEKGKIQLDRNQTAEAMKTFKLANTVNPAFPDAWFWMGRCNEQLGFKEDAKLNYEKAYSLDKTYTEAKEAAARL